MAGHLFCSLSHRADERGDFAASGDGLGGDWHGDNTPWPRCALPRAEPRLQTIGVRPRTPRVSAAWPVAAAMADTRRSAEVVHVTLDYAFVGRPAAVTIAPPMANADLPAVALGMLVNHLGVPVTDYRYLSQAETLRLDWQDPWFSAFENPILRRHQQSPVMAFVSVEPREVRQEALLRVADLEDWTSLDFGDGRTLTDDEVAAVEAAAKDLFRRTQSLMIDGEAASPDDMRVEFLSIGPTGLDVLGDTEAIDRTANLLGVVLSFPRTDLPAEVEMAWQHFPQGADTVPVTLSDPAGGIPDVVTRTVPSVTWTNYLKQWNRPETQPVIVPTRPKVTIPCLSLASAALAVLAVALVRRSAPRTRLGLVAATVLLIVLAVTGRGVTADIRLPVAGAPGTEDAAVILTRLLDNAAIAQLESREAAFAAALAPFVADPRRAAVGAEIRRGLSVNLPTGARARLEGIDAMQIEELTPTDTGLRVLARWTGRAVGGHFGHLHRRAVAYRGLFDLGQAEDAWLLDGLTILQADLQG
ncbi:MAG: hypothetical protein ACFB3T_07175 [Geminicoccaceae bacterium]